MKGGIFNNIYLTREEKYLLLFFAFCLLSFFTVKLLNLKIETVTEHNTSLIFPLDINSATYNQLLQVPGIGAVMAHRIIEYRQTHGGFKTLNQLKEIKGIGEKKLRQFYRYFKI